ncbi:MAG TPA: urease subunit beta [Chloroflexota bacterium]|jgi:urease beta subunit
MIPGEIFPGLTAITINQNRESIELDVLNTGDRPIQVGSHFHFFEVNRALRFERERAYGMRLDIGSGTAVRFEPGESRQVALIPFGGSRTVLGLNSLADGPLEAVHTRALERGAAFTTGIRVTRDGEPNAS